MLRQASVSDLISGRIDRSQGHIAITMRRYPRFVHRELRDEYLSAMSPERKLFEDWLGIKRRTGSHDTAFKRSRYEARFKLGDDGLEHLARLSRLSKRKDVFLVCQCRVGQRCHREMLMLLARKLFKAKVEGPYNEYPTFSRRLGRLFPVTWRRDRLRLRRTLLPEKDRQKHEHADR